MKKIFCQQAVGYIGKYLDLPTLLKIDHPSGEKPQPGQVLEWSAYDICEGWAIKRGFMTKRAARPDEARAANHLLRLSLEGRICLFLRPPNYSAEETKWETHPDVKEIASIQALEQDAKSDPWQETVEEETDEEEEEGEGNSQDGDDDEEDESEEETPVANSNKFALLLDSDD